MVDPGTNPALNGDPTEAWKALDLVNRWLQHAETKAAGTLAAAGVVGGLLYNLVSKQANLWAIASVAAFVCALAVIISGVTAGVALWPRLRQKDNPDNPLYFDHIARTYKEDADAPAYTQMLGRVASDREKLFAAVTQQVWANSAVARKKYV